MVIAVNAVAVALYPWYAPLFGTAELASESYVLFAMLSAGAAVFGIYAVFSGIFSQGALPTTQTRFNVLFLVSNLLLNICIVPFSGARGAAFATGLSFVAGALILRGLIHRHFAVRF
jgi:hypothetical protein